MGDLVPEISHCTVMILRDTTIQAGPCPVHACGCCLLAFLLCVKHLSGQVVHEGMNADMNAQALKQVEDKERLCSI